MTVRRHGTAGRWRALLWGAAALLVAALGGGALLVSGKSSPDATPLPAFRGEYQQFSALAAPRPAPEARFADETGAGRSLAELRGRVVLVNFWATWCVPCVAEMPALDRLQAALGPEGLTVLALSQDRGGTEAVVPFYAKLNLAHLAVRLDPRGAAARAFGVQALPVTVLIDAEGRELGRMTGPAAWDSPEALALIRAAIALKPQPAS